MSIPSVSNGLVEVTVRSQHFSAQPVTKYERGREKMKNWNRIETIRTGISRIIVPTQTGYLPENLPVFLPFCGNHLMSSPTVQPPLDQDHSPPFACVQLKR